MVKECERLETKFTFFNSDMEEQVVELIVFVLSKPM